MPIFKIQTPVKSKHIETRSGYKVRHRIVDVIGNIFFETMTIGLIRINSSHVRAKSLYDQTAAALNAKYGRKNEQTTP